jgi:hypothetical protein
MKAWIQTMTYCNKLQLYHVAYSESQQEHFLGIYDMLELAKSKKLDRKTYVWKVGMQKWIQAGKIPELKPLFATPPEVPKELKDCVQLFDDNETIIL